MESVILFSDVRGWKNVSIHLNSNKPIKIKEYGQYVTPLSYRPFFKNKTEWGHIEIKREIRDEDVVYIWMNITDYKNRINCYYLQPFLGNKYKHVPYIEHLTEEVIMSDEWLVISQTRKSPYMHLFNELLKKINITN